MDDIIVRYISLPLTAKGFVSDSPDGTHNIFINSRYSIEMQKEILKHELKHVRNDDFHNFDDIELVEKLASG